MSVMTLIKWKGPVKLMQQVKTAHLFFTIRVKSVPRYHFRLAYVLLQMAIKDPFLKMEI